MASTPEPHAVPPIRRLQLIAITLVGILCAVIGVSFAVVGNQR